MQAVGFVGIALGPSLNFGLQHADVRIAGQMHFNQYTGAGECASQQYSHTHDSSVCVTAVHRCASHFSGAPFSQLISLSSPRLLLRDILVLLAGLMLAAIHILNFSLVCGCFSSSTYAAAMVNSHSKTGTASGNLCTHLFRAFKGVAQTKVPPSPALSQHPTQHRTEYHTQHPHDTQQAVCWLHVVHMIRGGYCRGVFDWCWYREPQG